jgi:hypothetical protein
MRAITVLIVLLLVSACDGAAYQQNLRLSHFEISEGDYHSIAVATFKLIDAQGSIHTIVVPPDLDRRAVDALKHVAKVVRADASMPPSDGSLPAGVFVLHDFSIDEESATIEGLLGPVTHAMTAANLPDCGKTFTVAFTLQGGDWVSHSYKTGTCAGTRHWVPVDAKTPPP